MHGPMELRQMRVIATLSGCGFDDLGPERTSVGYLERRRYVNWINWLADEMEAGRPISRETQPPNHVLGA